MPTITVSCTGLTDAEGAAAVEDVREEFTHRPWQRAVRCEWTANALRLTVTNDFDSDGQALLDEFWDAVHATVTSQNPVHFKVESVS
jgi:hypothetical protein